MLQLTALSRHALAGMTAIPEWKDLDELEKAADIAVGALRRRRQELGSAGRPWQRAQAWFDRHLRTDREEYFDAPGYPDSGKVRLARDLHVFNRILGSYRRFLSCLRPLVKRAVDERGRAARVLELCSGSGEFALALAERAHREGLAVEVTGSDIVPAQVKTAARRARRQGNPAGFVVLDALDLGHNSRESYDIVFMAQSLHHFRPGQLARTIAGARRAGALAYLGVDGRRSFAVLAGLLLMTSLWLQPDFMHDGMVSGLRFYTEAELALIARLAAPAAAIRVERSGLTFSVVEVIF